MAGDALHFGLLVGSIVVILIGLVGIIIPVLPGVLFVWLGLTFVSWLDGWQTVPMPTVVVFGVLTIAVMILQQVVGVAGAKRFGASRLGLIGCAVGLVVGVLLGGPVGIIAGPAIGAFVGEMIAGRTSQAAGRAAMGSVLGLLSGMVVQFILALVMIGWYLVKFI